MITNRLEEKGCQDMSCDINMSTLSFWEHHSHSDGSNFRLKDSINTVKSLVNTAIEKGLCGITLTDHETVSLHIRIMKYIQQLKKDKIKLNKLIREYGEEYYIEEANKEKLNIKLLNKMPENFNLGLGNEIYLVDSIEEVRDSYESGITKFPHFILIAKDKIGHRQIRELSSVAWKNSFYTGLMERVPTTKKYLLDTIKENKGHVIASTACVGGEFMLCIANLIQASGKNILFYKKKIHYFIKYCLDIFGEDFYIEIQPTISEEIKQMNKKAIEIAKAYGIKCIITTDAHYSTKDMAKVHESYLNSKEGDREVAEFYATTYIMSVEEIWEYFKDCLSFEKFKELINNTLSLGNKISEYTLQHETIIKEIAISKAQPKHIFKQWYDKYKYIKFFSQSESIQDRYFLQIIEEGFIKKQQEFNEENINRINIELKEIWGTSKKLNQHMSSYYNLVRHIVDLMWDEDRGNSFVGIARGSVTGFYTCFLIDITQMNPIKWGLPHWRHLTAERYDMPDIDIDTEAAKRQNIFRACKEEFGYENVLNIATFKTEGSKSSVLTACRGMGINNDDAQFMADLIPFERGASWSLSDCLFGNKKDEKKPISQFIDLVKQYEGLETVMLAIEGLIVGRSIHASGLYIFKDGYIEQNAMMRAPNGDFITQWNMDDSDWCGGLKVDFLTIEAEDKLRVCSELLLEHKKIKWKGSWRETYNSFLHPDVINYTDLNMWKKVQENDIESLFQFSTPIGLATARELKPTTLPQLADSNSLMRLMGQNEDSETPIKTYAKYKSNIKLWYKEMKEYGLTDNDIKILEPHLLPIFGVASTQEDIMEISMNPKISNFDIHLSNKLRKSIAKKDKKAQQEIKEIFFQKGRENETSEKLLDYVWNVQISRQIGYSFSRNHTFPYSNIAVQEMNLAHFYNPIFWNCACLSVDSGAIDDFNNYKDEKEYSNEKSTNYGKMAQAISNIQQRDVNIWLPDINKAKIRFSPDEENNAIIYGMKGIMGISSDTCEIIMEHRPFINLEDFYKRMVLVKRQVTTSTGTTQNKSLVSTSQTIMLIKAGAFDKIEKKSREETLENFLHKLYPNKTSINTTTIEKVIQKGIVPTDYKTEVRLYRFRNILMKNKKIQDKNTKSIKWHLLSNKDDSILDSSVDFFSEYFVSEMEENRDYRYDEQGNIWVAMGTDRKGSFNDIYKRKIDNFKKWLNSVDCLDIYNQLVFEEIKNNYMQGTISTWEMESMNFYYHEHELANIDTKRYYIENFNDLPENPEVIGFTKYKNREYPKFNLSRIAGTVLDRDKVRHSITILTPSTVVLIKFYSGQFTYYDKQVSTIDENGKKTVLESSWFKRGNKVLITGFRRGDQFKPKRYKNSIFPHTVQLITAVDEDNSLMLQSERIGIDAE